MAITAEVREKILRYHYVEKWKVGTIARQLGIHPYTVRNAIIKADPEAKIKSKRASIVDPYWPFILETLGKYPDIPASRLYVMIRERGYKGSASHLRHLIAAHRPKKPAEAFLRLKTLAGEQAQVDWAHTGQMTFGKAVRNLMAFVMVLSFSRKIFLRFYLSQRMGNFLQGHRDAFDAFGGVPRVCLYDNLRTAVLERQGDAIRFHPTMLKLASHYRYEPRPVAVCRGNEKGRVERAIRYIRSSFLQGRTWESLDDLNAQAMRWCQDEALERRCPEDRQHTVQEMFLQEQPLLLNLPDNPFICDEREEVSVGKTPYVRFDLNDYSIPHTHVQRVLTVLATQHTVSVLDGGEIIAKHPRSYDKGEQIEDELHIKTLAARKKEARQHRGQNRLTQAIPASEEFLQKAAERGYNLKMLTRHLLEFLDDYGVTELSQAIDESLSAGTYHENNIRLHLEHLREKKQPCIPLSLPHDERVREMTIKPHNLHAYDELQNQPEDIADEK